MQHITCCSIRRCAVLPLGSLFHPRRRAYLLLGHNKVASLPVSQALATLESKDGPVTLQDYTKLIGKYSQKPAQPLKAEAVLYYLEKQRLVMDIVPYHLAMRACANSVPAMPEKAEEILRLIRKKGFFPSVVTFSILVSAYGNSVPVRTKEAEEVLKRMAEEGIQPNLVTLTALIRVFTNAGKTDVALRILDQIEREIPHPDAVPYGTLMSAFADKNPPEIESMEALFKRMQKNGVDPDDASFSSMIRAHTKLGQIEDAELFLKDAEASHKTLRVVTYTNLMNAYASQVPARADLALQLLDRMVKVGVAPNEVTFSILFKACAQSDPVMVREAESLSAKMKSFGVRHTLVTYNALMSVFSKAAAPVLAKAEHLFATMKNEGICPDEITYGSYLHVLARSKASPIKVNAVLEEMTSQGIRPNHIHMSLMVATLTARGNIESGFEQLKRMEELMDVPPDCLLEYYRKLARHAIAERRSDLVFPILDYYEEKADRRYESMLYLGVASSWGSRKYSNPEMLYQLMERIESKWKEKVPVWIRAMYFQAAAGVVAPPLVQATKVLKDVRKEDPKMEGCQELASALERMPADWLEMNNCEISFDGRSESSK